MADRKITDLAEIAAGGQATGDFLTIVDVSETAAVDKNKKITIDNLFTGIPGNVDVAGGVASTDGITLQSNGVIKARGDSLSQTDAGLAIYRSGSASSDIVARINYNGSATFDSTVAAPYLQTETAQFDTRVKIATATEGHQFADELTLASTQHCGMTIRSGAGTYSLGNIYFSNATSGSGEYAGSIEYLHFGNGSLMRFGVNSTERMRITNDGDVCFATTSEEAHNSDSASFNTDGYIAVNHVNGKSSGSNYVAFNYNAGEIGSITQNGTAAVAYNTSSDYRLKENVTAFTDGIARLQQLKPCRFNFIAEPERQVDGFLAHEAQKVVPLAVTGTHNEVDADGNAVMQGIDQSKLVPLLTAALQEAIAKIETLETKVAALEAG